VICTDATRCIAWASQIMGDFTYQGWWAAIGHEIAGELVAVVIYTRDTDIEMHVVAAQGKRWLTSDFVSAAFAYPFAQLHMERVSATARKSNGLLQMLLIKLGFRIEGIRRKASHGEDLILFGMLREECRYG
jgi:RimJ/RimL family protein N-acetyltransferase